MAPLYFRFYELSQIDSYGVTIIDQRNEYRESQKFIAELDYRTPFDTKLPLLYLPVKEKYFCF